MWTIAIVTTICLVALGLQLRRLAYGLLDPIVVGSIGVPLSGALVSTLAVGGLITTDVIGFFCVSAISFIAGSAIFTRHGQSASLIQTMHQSVNTKSVRHCVIVISASILITMALSSLAIKAGAGGDARQEFNRIFRPLVLVQSGLFYVSLILLLHRGFSRPLHTLLLILLVVPTFPFSGKSFALPVAFHFGLLLYSSGRKLSLRYMLAIGFVLFIGYTLISFLSYGSADLQGSMRLLVTRLWMSGDVYIYAYQQGALENIRPLLHATFLEYVLHPVTSIFGHRAYEVPIGAMLASDVVGDDVFTGPNTQLPVLLNLYFGSNYYAIAILSAIFGWLCFCLRRRVVLNLFNPTGWPIIGVYTAAIFVPAYGFFDLSLVAINLISITAGTIGAAICIVFVEAITQPIPVTKHHLS